MFMSKFRRGVKLQRGHQSFTSVSEVFTLRGEEKEAERHNSLENLVSKEIINT